MKVKRFEVPGAGQIELGYFGCYTGSAYGISLGVSWGNHGFCGGVLGLEEMKKLITHLQEQVDLAGEKSEPEYMQEAITKFLQF